MLANILIALGIIYVIFGAVVASIFVLLDSGTRGGGGGITLMDPIRWVGITVGWFPIIIYYVAKIVWDVFGFAVGAKR